MKIGVGSYAYRWSIGISDYKPAHPLTPVKLLERAAALGAKVIQYADNMPLNAESVETVREIGRAAAEHGMDVELGTHGATSENLRAYLGLASTLRASVVRVTLSNEDLAMPRHDLLKILTDAGDAFHEAGSIIALENHFLLASRGLASMVAELDHPAVGVCLDVANSIANGEWPKETIERLAPYALNLHIKDYRFDIDPYGVGFRIVGTPIGEGHLDVSYVFRVLREAGRDVNAIVEHWIPKERLEDKRSVLDIESEWTRRSLEETRSHIPASIG